jgi:hypothetical protein
MNVVVPQIMPRLARPVRRVATFEQLVADIAHSQNEDITISPAAMRLIKREIKRHLNQPRNVPK